MGKFEWPQIDDAVDECWTTDKKETPRLSAMNAEESHGRSPATCLTSLPGRTLARA